MSAISSSKPGIPAHAVVRIRIKKLAQFVFPALIAILLIILEDFLSDNQGSGHFLWTIYLDPHPERRQAAWWTLSFTTVLFWVYVWALFNAIRPVRIVLWIYFALSVSVQYSYFQAFHRFMTTVDYWTAMLSPAKLWTENIPVFFNWRSLLVIALLSVGMFVYKPRKWARFWSVYILAGLLLVAYLLKIFSPFDQSLGFSTVQLSFMLTDLRQAQIQSVIRETVPVLSGRRPANNVVLIIDETVRGDHLNINGYQRPTAPYLQILVEKGLVYNWGVVSSGATCTVSSNPLLITGVIPGKQSFSLTSQWPTIFQYARSMGYRTFYINAQTDYFYNGLTTKDLVYIDQLMKSSSFPSGGYIDEEVGKYIHGITLQSTGNFFVVNKRGIHFYYEDEYPASAAVWLPVPKGRDYLKYPELASNGFDNAMHYNLDKFFLSLIPDAGQLGNTVYVYTSDHGETLQEDGATWPHCHNTRHEALVPLLIITGLKLSPDTSYQASHSNVLATLLDFMQVPEQARLHAYAPSLLSATPAQNQPRFYLDGELKPVRFDP